MAESLSIISFQCSFESEIIFEKVGGEMPKDKKYAEERSIEKSSVLCIEITDQLNKSLSGITLVTTLSLGNCMVSEFHHMTLK